MLFAKNCNLNTLFSFHLSSDLSYGANKIVNGNVERKI